MSCVLSTKGGGPNSDKTVQKRSCYANTFIKKGSKIKRKMIIPLRPCIKNSYSPDKILLLINKKAKKNIKAGECIKKNLVH